MNRIAVNSIKALPQSIINLTKKFAKNVLAQLGRDKWDLSVLLCDDDTIRALNSQYRGKKSATDVLSFSQGFFVQAQDERNKLPGSLPRGRFLAGDIVISLDTLQKNARRFKIEDDEELRRLLIHGILHLDGMDHRSNSKDEPMLQLQEKILTKLKGERIMGSIE